MSVVISGDSPNLTGATLSSPTVNGTPIMGASVITSGTAQASTSGTAINFTGIPSWVKRITVILNGVKGSGTSPLQIQIGAGSYTTSGYDSSSYRSSGSGAHFSTGFSLAEWSSATVLQGSVTIVNISGNTWVESGSIALTDAGVVETSGGAVSLSGTLDRLRLTMVNGTDTFDAGSINILYE